MYLSFSLSLSLSLFCIDPSIYPPLAPPTFDLIREERKGVESRVICPYMVIRTPFDLIREERMMTVVMCVSVPAGDSTVGLDGERLR